MKLPTRTVRDVMDTESHALRASQPVMDAVRTLVRDGVTGAPVVDETGKVVGMITERECLGLFTGAAGADMPQGTVADHMAPPRIVEPEMDVFYAAGLMRAQNVRRFAVVGGDRLLGVITRKDILRALESMWCDPMYGTPAPAPRQ